MRRFLLLTPALIVLILFGTRPIDGVLAIQDSENQKSKDDGPPNAPKKDKKEEKDEDDDKPKPKPKSKLDAKERRALAAEFAENAESKMPLHLMRLPAKADGIEITPATQIVATTKRVVIVTVKSKVDVGWFVTHSDKNPPVEWFELPGAPFILIFPNNVEETINVHAFASIEGKPVMAKATIKVVKDPEVKPKPKPDEEPPVPEPDEVRPLPAGSKVHVTIIRDVESEKKASKTDKTTNLAVSQAVIKGLQDRKHWRWTLEKDADAATIKTKGFDAYITKVGRLPMYIVQDEKGLVLDYRPLEGTPANFLAAIDKLAPPPK